MIHEFHKTGKIEPVPVFKNPLIKNTAGGSGITQLRIVIVVKGDFRAAVAAKLMGCVFALGASKQLVTGVATVKGTDQQLHFRDARVNVHRADQDHDRNGERYADR